MIAVDGGRVKGYRRLGRPSVGRCAWENAGLQPELRTVATGEGELAVWDWPGAGPPLVLAHATGFHGRCWDSIARLFPGRRCLAIDFRGHGRSSKPAPPYPWRMFGEDLVALDVTGAIGVGHSMGGHSLVQAAAMRPGAFATLVLVDPVIYPPEYYGVRQADVGFIERRRARWASPDEMYERFRGRAPFAAWRPEILRDYCEYALLPAGDGFELACPPAVEASIYRQSSAPESNLYGVIPSIGIPVTVMRAGTTAPPGVFDLNASPTWEKLAERFPRGRDVFLAERNHYVPMEAPELVAEEIRAASG
jgi:lipase